MCVCVCVCVCVCGVCGCVWGGGGGAGWGMEEGGEGGRGMQIDFFKVDPFQKGSDVQESKHEVLRIVSLIKKKTND